MPIRRVHPRGGQCEEPQFVADAREAAQVFSGRFADNDALQTYFLSVMAGGSTPYSGEGLYGYFSEAVASDGGELTGGLITDNGSYTVFLPPGKYVFGALGDFDGGTLTAFFSNGDYHAQIVDDSNPLTDNGGFVFHSPADRVRFELAGATNPEITIYLNATR